MLITKKGEPWFATSRERGIYRFVRDCAGGLHVIIRTPYGSYSANASVQSRDGSRVYVYGIGHRGYHPKKCESFRDVLRAFQHVRDEAKRYRNRKVTA